MSQNLQASIPLIEASKWPFKKEEMWTTARLVEETGLPEAYLLPTLYQLSKHMKADDRTGVYPLSYTEEGEVLVPGRLASLVSYIWKTCPDKEDRKKYLEHLAKTLSSGLRNLPPEASGLVKELERHLKVLKGSPYERHIKERVVVAEGKRLTVERLPKEKQARANPPAEPAKPPQTVQTTQAAQDTQAKQAAPPPGHTQINAQKTSQAQTKEEAREGKPQRPAPSKTDDLTLEEKKGGPDEETPMVVRLGLKVKELEKEIQQLKAEAQRPESNQALTNELLERLREEARREAQRELKQSAQEIWQKVQGHLEAQNPGALREALERIQELAARQKALEERLEELTRQKEGGGDEALQRTTALEEALKDLAALRERLTALEDRLAQMEEKQGVMADFLNHVVVEHLLKDATLGYVRVGRNLKEVPILSEEAIQILERLAQKLPPVHTPPNAAPSEPWWRRLRRKR